MNKKRASGPTDGLPDRDLSDYELRCPQIADAVQLWRLVRESPFLDPNSCYTYLLLCSDFADTCVVACDGTELGGFVTAYRPPRRPDVIFVWQIGVAASARRRGLGKRLLRHLVCIPGCRGVRFLEATVTRSNEPSRRLFEAFAADLAVPLEQRRGFRDEDFGPAGHETEELLSIGPLVRTEPDGSSITQDA